MFILWNKVFNTRGRTDKLFGLYGHSFVQNLPCASTVSQAIWIDPSIQCSVCITEKEIQVSGCQMSTSDPRKENLIPSQTNKIVSLPISNTTHTTQLVVGCKKRF
ncbi:hypothetical protein XENTR_v10006148 [Xenopus tropicalis]|nr:hypothetical protein XENTR_v10006148 [Xenopus tropicalis]